MLMKRDNDPKMLWFSFAWGPVAVIYSVDSQVTCQTCVNILCFSATKTLITQLPAGQVGRKSKVAPE